MANAILSSLLSMLNSLSSSCSPTIAEDLNKLKVSIVGLHPFVNDAEEKMIRDDQAKRWLQELKDVAYDAEDALEEYELEVRLKSEVKSSTQLPFQDGIVSKIHDVVGRFNEIGNQCKTLQLRDVSVNLNQHANMLLLNDETVVYGREDDWKRVVELVLENERSKLCVIPIVGTRGVGKTTLAKILYNDSMLGEFFDAKGWVCVSEDFDMVRLMTAIVASMSEKPCVYAELEHLRTLMREELEGKRFLLVLDNVCNEDEDLWERLRATLMVGLEGSTVIVTTLSKSVANITKTVPFYHLKCLSVQDTLSLFQICAFRNEDVIVHPNLVSIGKEIIKKVGGLPFAAKMLGECLRYDLNENKWLGILQSDVWNDHEGEGAFWPALFLSYYFLPAQLKQCVIYCALFPKDCLFKKDALVRLWIAEGFIQQIEGRRMEDIGTEYFHELLRMSFFQCFQTDRQEFLLHELAHELAKTVSEKEIFILEDADLCSIPSYARHSAFVLQDSSSPVRIQQSNEKKSLRTFLVIHRLLHTCSVSFLLSKSRLHLHMTNDIFINLQCLRVLDLSETDVVKLPDSIDKLKHLRYLSLNHTKIENLPESLCNLYLLQTMEMRDCSDLRELPRGIKNLINLRHLYISNYMISVPMPPGIGLLTNLQTLSTFCVGSEDSGHCVIKELLDLVNLRGELCISGLENVSNADDSREALKNTEHVEKLELHSGVITTYSNEGFDFSWFDEPHNEQQSFDNGFFSYMPEQKPNPEEESVFESLKPHINLKDLVIKCYFGVRFPNWISDPSFSNLVCIKLDVCSKCKVLPPLGQLPCLQHLTIQEFSELQSIGHEFINQDSTLTANGFPSLETLQFVSMYKWEEWIGVDKEAFPRLHLLNLNYCPKLKTMPQILSSLKKLVLWVCDKLASLPCLPSLTSLELRGHCGESIWAFMPEDLLARLQSLKIGGYKNLNSLPLQHLYALKELDISGCQYSSCHSSSLGLILCKLEFLEYLKIQHCPEICFLPDQELPPNLRVLNIFYCPLLAEWCQSHGRSKLLHIPRVIIDRKNFHPSGI